VVGESLLGYVRARSCALPCLGGGVGGADGRLAAHGWLAWGSVAGRAPLCARWDHGDPVDRGFYGQGMTLVVTRIDDELIYTGDAGWRSTGAPVRPRLGHRGRLAARGDHGPTGQAGGRARPPQV